MEQQRQRRKMRVGGTPWVISVRSKALIPCQNGVNEMPSQALGFVLYSQEQPHGVACTN